jgi:hypothetical protein
VQNERKNCANDEEYVYTVDWDDEDARDCWRCGLRIDTIQQMGVHCDNCDIHFHKKCEGTLECKCPTQSAHTMEDTEVHIDLTTLDAELGSDAEQGQ